MANASVPDRVLPLLEAVATQSDHIALVRDLSVELGATLSLSALRKGLADKSGLSPTDASKVVNGLIELLHLCANSKAPVAQVLQDLTANLEKHAPPDWRTRNLERWRRSLPELERALDPDGSLFVMHKTIDLAYEHQTILLSARIFTDIRPVFDSSALRIVRAVVTHMLTVRFSDGPGPARMMQFAMDSADIEELRAACDRALTKTETVKKGVASLPWQTDIVGGEK